jgi:hypothetical protein
MIAKPQKAGKAPFTVFDRLVPNVLAVDLKQIEGAQDGPAVADVAADAVENRKSAVVAHDGPAIDHA